MPCAANRTFSKVKSRAMSPRHPEVPNLIEVTGELSAEGLRISSRARPFLEVCLLAWRVRGLISGGSEKVWNQSPSIPRSRWVSILVQETYPMNLLKTPLRHSLRRLSKSPSSRGFALIRHLYWVMGLSMIGLAAVTVFFYVKTLWASGASVDLTFRTVPIGVALVVFLLGVVLVRSALSLFRLDGWEKALEPVNWPDSDSISQPAGSERVEKEKAVRDASQCTACGARIQDASAVSPRGDVRCAYCNAWFNVHR